MIEKVNKITANTLNSNLVPRIIPPKFWLDGQMMTISERSQSTF
jgi:hypothetical protein